MVGKHSFRLNLGTFFFPGFLGLFLLILASLEIHAQDTQQIYLSGTGLGNTVTWKFRCSDGRNSGKWDKIEVPSQWELQGFGEYTYGRWYKKAGVKAPSMEEGIYKRMFRVPRDWNGKNVQICFGGVMTDTKVLINGIPAGDVHQGGFYQFSYDISALLKYGRANDIEVQVKKHSENKSVNAAERRADWWLFGGIYRPVWLEVKPENHIDRLAVDARYDGTLNANVYTTGNIQNAHLAFNLSPVMGKGTPFTWDSRKAQHSIVTAFNPQNFKINQSAAGNETNSATKISGNVAVSCHWDGIQAWTPETPYLYLLTVSLVDANGKVIHTTSTRIGFRTIDFRPHDGIYLNNTKLVMKGINRHSFYPDGGRTTNKAISIQDAKLIKEMNMNAVRSHYPPDKHFLDVCDSLGLLYIDELAGWQNSYDTNTGSKLIKEMISRDVNHPCIVLWSNGNEGGWNTALDSLFRKYDPQNRHVIHPWADFNGIDTQHYPAYLTGVGRFNNGNKVFMPTEFMHGMYDQGLGAGLEDFWARYTSSPLFAGGFMWAFCDEAVRRSDWNGKLDSDGFNAPDGIVGPYREKEGSFYSVREIWSPIKVESLKITPSFNGRFLISNRYLYTSLGACSMSYRLYRCASPLQEASSTCVVDSGSVSLPDLSPGETGFASMTLPKHFFEADILELNSYGLDGNLLCTRTFPVHSAEDYLMNEQQLSKRTSTTEIKPSAFPQIIESDSIYTLCSAALSVSFRKSNATIVSIIRSRDQKSVSLTDGPLPVGMKIKLKSVTTRKENGDAVLCARYTGAVDSIVWRLAPDGLLYMKSVLLNKASGGGGFDDAFTDTDVYNFGFTFSFPEKLCSGVRWLGRGPYRVWKNRIPGTNYGVWSKAYNNTITGESYEHLTYPEFKGYHANMYWATIQSPATPFTVYSETDGVYLRLFTPEEPRFRQDGVNTMPDFPAGDLSFLLDIPGIRSFKPISQHGPQSQPGIIRIKKGDEGLNLNLLFDFR